jgi:hypothetical protein
MCIDYSCANLVEYIKERKHVDNLDAMAMRRFNGPKRNESRSFQSGFMWIKIITSDTLL